jgi:hypothetical protein
MDRQQREDLDRHLTTEPEGDDEDYAEQDARERDAEIIELRQELAIINGRAGEIEAALAELDPESVERCPTHEDRAVAPGRHACQECITLSPLCSHCGEPIAEPQIRCGYGHKAGFR